MFGLGKKKNDLVKLLPEIRGKYLCNEPMSKHTWFAVGGPAEVMFCPKDDADLSWFLKAKPYNLPICVVGGGSNLLVRDGGIPGVVHSCLSLRKIVKTFRKLSDIFKKRRFKSHGCT